MRYRNSSPRRAPLQLQMLEQRENPAGNIVTSVEGGVLTLTGTDQADHFTIKQIPGDLFTVTGISGTTIDNNASTTTTLAATSVKIVLKGGDDSVTLDPTAPFALTGSLTIDGGDGNNGLNLFTTASAISLKDFTFTGGDGADHLIIGQAGAATTVFGAVSITPGDGGSITSMANATINGDVTDKAGFGADSLSLTTVSAKKNVNADFGFGDGTLTADTNTVITGGMGYKALDGNDDITLGDTTVNGVTGVKIDGGIGDANLTTSGAVAIPGGGLTVTGIKGTSTVNVSGTLNVSGDLKANNLNLGITNTGTVTAGNLSLTGADSALLAPSGGTFNVLKNLTVASNGPNGGIGGYTGGPTTNHILNVDGNLTATATRNISLHFTGGLVKGSVSLASKSGFASLEQQNFNIPLEIRKGLTVKAQGSVSVDLNTNGIIKVGGDVSLTSTEDAASMRNSAGDMTLLGGIRASGRLGASLLFFSPTVTGGTVAKDVTLTSALGNVFVSVGATKLTLNGKLTVTAAGDASLFGDLNGAVTFQKDVTIKGTSGDADVNLGGVGNAAFNGKLTVTGGNNARLGSLFGSLDGTATFQKDVTLTGKYLNAGVDFSGAGDAVFNGKLTATGGNNAAVSLTTAGVLSSAAGDLAAAATRGNASLVVSGGGKAFAGNVTLKGYGAFLTQNTAGTATTYAKNLTVTAGYGINDTVLMSGLYTVTGDASFNLGDESNAVILSSSTTAVDFAGKLTVKTGNGNDTTTFVNVQAAKDVSVTSLAGVDVVYVDGGSVITGLFTADTGAGDDTVDLGHTTGLAGPAATFAGKATIKTGAGNDHLHLGKLTGGDANSIAVFGVAGSTIDGGTGFNLLDPTSLALPLANLTVTGF